MSRRAPLLSDLEETMRAVRTFQAYDDVTGEWDVFSVEPVQGKDRAWKVDGPYALFLMTFVGAATWHVSTLEGWNRWELIGSQNEVIRQALTLSRAL